MPWRVPGEEDYSAAARERFGLLAAELGYLRRHAQEPVLDLVRRVIATLGLDIELRATPEFERRARIDQLGAFLDAVAAYVDVDGDASLTGLLAYLQAEVEQGAGLDQAVPSDREAVKLLTVHKAKGLEWEVVFLPALMQGIFPSDRVTDNWVTNPAVLPADLRGDAAAIPQLADATNAAMAEYKARLTEQQLLAEDRLGYVGVTRAKRLLVGSGHWWRADLVRPRVPVGVPARDQSRRPGPRTSWSPRPSRPGRRTRWSSTPSPGPGRRRWIPRRCAAARTPRRRCNGRGAGSPSRAAMKTRMRRCCCSTTRTCWRAGTPTSSSCWPRPGRPGPVSSRCRFRRVCRRPRCCGCGPTPRRTRPNWPGRCPGGPPARPASAPASISGSSGTSAPRWRPVRWASSCSSTLTTCPIRPTRATPDEQDLRALCDAFASGQFGGTIPYAIEAPFSLGLDGRLVRGRIDAVYETDPQPGAGFRFLVVDWKTSAGETADPWQLAIYRLAWAEANGSRRSRWTRRSTTCGPIDWSGPRPWLGGPSWKTY